MTIRNLLHPVAFGSALVAVMIGGCSRGSSSAAGSDSAAAAIAERTDDPAAEASVRATVASFGARMQTVSLLAPDSTVEAQLREAYGALVTPELLDRWTADPRMAPGRLVSSPWPDSIQVRAVRRSSADRFDVSGDLVYATSADRPKADDESAGKATAGNETAGKATAEHEPGGGGAVTSPVRIEVARTPQGEWRIASYSEGAGGVDSPRRPGGAEGADSATGSRGPQPAQDSDTRPRGADSGRGR